MSTSATAMDRLGRRDDHWGMTSLTSAVLIAAALATGWVAGVLGHYAHTLMPALRTVDDRTFVTAFQAIDRAILNPWFMVAFFGAPVLAAAGAVLTWGDGGALRIWLLVAAALLVAGVIMTVTINVPLNDAIKAAGDPDRIADLAAVRGAFDESRWATWNLVRTVTTVAAFGILVAAVGDGPTP
jgi:uncharacterized membrane protein